MIDSKEHNFTQRIPLFTSLLALLLGLFAAFFSWRAYQISNETKETVLYQMRPNIIVGDWLPTGFGATPEGQYTCFITVRLQNVGGMPTSLVGYDTNISYQGKKISFSNETKRGFALTDDTVSPILSKFRAVIFTNGNVTLEQLSRGDFSETVNFPVQIESYSAIDVDTVFYYEFDLSKHKPDHDNFNYDDAVLVSYTFHFTSGQSLEISAGKPCIYIVPK